jgi:adenosylhomocysteine nucleosidase
LAPVAVLSALPEELQHLLDDLEGTTEEPLAVGTAWQGRCEGREVVLAHAGMGKVASALVATSLIERTRPSALVVTGVAGSLDPALEVGDVLVATRVVQHDAGVLTPSGLERYQAGHLPFVNPTDDLGWPCSPDLVARALAAARHVRLDPLPASAGGHGAPPRVVEGVVATGDVFVNDPSTRQRLHEELGAHAVEMEGAAVAQVAATLGVPHLVVRAMSDLAGHDSGIDFATFLHHVSGSSARVVRSLVAAT